MTTTDQTTTPAKGVKHAHGETAMDARVAALEARVTALESAGPWFGLPDPWAGIPFGSLPAAAAGQWWPAGGDKGGATFGNLLFRNRPAGVNVVVLDGVSNATFDLIDFDTVPEGIYLNNCHDLILSRLRVAGGGIFGPYTRTGFHSGNLIQATNCSNVTFRDLLVEQPYTAGPAGWGTEDIVSLGGARGAWGNVIVERFSFDAGAWQSPSGTGIFVGDGASGHDVTIRDGILTNPGQCAIGTGEEGPYTFQRIDAKSTRTDVNTALQLRSPRVSMGGMRVDWPTTAYTTGASFTDLGGNDWAATL